MKRVSVNDIVLTNLHLGCVRYVGPMYNPSENCVTTEIYVGLELVEATGNNDGSVNDIRYFETEKGHNYGLLIPQRKIEKVLSGWELLKKFGEQHSVIIDVAKHWNESISRATQYHERILELEERLDSQDNLCKCEQKENVSKPREVNPMKLKISIPTRNETPNADSWCGKSCCLTPVKYNIKRFSQGSQLTDFPKQLPNIPYTPTTQSSFRRISMSSSDSEYLGQLREENLSKPQKINTKIQNTLPTSRNSPENSLYDPKSADFQSREKSNMKRFSQVSQSDFPETFYIPSPTPRSSFRSDSSVISPWDVLERQRSQNLNDKRPSATSEISTPVRPISENAELFEQSAYYITGSQYRLNKPRPSVDSQFTHADLNFDSISNLNLLLKSRSL